MFVRRVRMFPVTSLAASLLGTCLVVSSGCDDGAAPTAGGGVVDVNKSANETATKKGKGEAKAIKSGDPQDLIPKKDR